MQLATYRCNQKINMGNINRANENSADKGHGNIPINGAYKIAPTSHRILIKLLITPRGAATRGQPTQLIHRRCQQCTDENKPYLLAVLGSEIGNFNSMYIVTASKPEYYVYPIPVSRMQKRVF